MGNLSKSVSAGNFEKVVKMIAFYGSLIVCSNVQFAQKEYFVLSKGFQPARRRNCERGLTLSYHQIFLSSRRIENLGKGRRIVKKWT
jgi:hypothetical protein